MDCLVVRESKLLGEQRQGHRKFGASRPDFGLPTPNHSLFYLPLLLLNLLLLSVILQENVFSTCFFLDFVNFVTVLRHTGNGSLCKRKLFDDPITQGASLAAADVLYLVFTGMI
jgi:hypothetical protein